ncbi:MAG: glycosyltransferase [Lactobacillus crispatus]|jgi:hypothetical protein|nr:glycosyltransferase [Lactobacillus crispatus]MCI1336265.1 glycosyltransferase [Lactobacillus crispatus]MCI1365758.1 glycosyltransferase [Lactobacillus crispatus]MCI1494140.1 glycosyltransferase [Lactobacillus crispatus]MCI1524614.1 glycosyltransferase [Lactobacillus crispatus]
MKILYLMKLDWYWIKQRPQYIAENLSQNNDVSVLYKYSYRRKDLQKNKTNSNIKLIPIFTIPNFLNKISILKKISNFIIKSKIRKVIKEIKPDIIYFSSIFPVDCIPDNYKGKILYDCMDDYAVLETQPIVKEERDLILRANTVLVTSEHLQKTIINRYGNKITKKLFLVRNGFNALKVNNVETNSCKVRPKCTISYIGTVSRWFDFGVLLASLKKYPELEYKIIGPVDSNIDLPKSSRIHFLGTVEHDKLYKVIKDDIALVMPFKLNKIVESVDPVKLYEYIYFNKNIITIKYPEIDRFKNYVYFYTDVEEYTKQVGKVLKNKKVKYNSTEREKFLQNNSWTKRAEKIEEIISQ